jgi:hypothetical protein
MPRAKAAQATQQRTRAWVDRAVFAAVWALQRKRSCLRWPSRVCVCVCVCVCVDCVLSTRGAHMKRCCSRFHVRALRCPCAALIGTRRVCCGGVVPCMAHCMQRLIARRALPAHDCVSPFAEICRRLPLPVVWHVVARWVSRPCRLSCGRGCTPGGEMHARRDGDREWVRSDGRGGCYARCRVADI